MTHIKMTYFFFIITALTGIHHTTTCMDKLAEEKAKKEIDYLEEMRKVATAKQHNEELKGKHIDEMYTKKIEKAKTEIDKLQSDIHQKDLHIKTVDGLIAGGSDGLSKGISDTIQYGGRRLIDLWLDGSLTTAETLTELNTREEILTKRIQNIRESAAAQRQYLTTSAEIEELKKETVLEIKKVRKELKRNAELYEQVATGRNKSQQTEECHQNVSELPTENKPAEQNTEKKSDQPQSLTQAANEVKAKTTLFGAIATSCAAAATKVGKCADVLAGYSFAYITQNPRLKETFIGKHATGINRALVIATIAIVAYSGYTLYKSKAVQSTDDDDDIFADDDNY